MTDWLLANPHAGAGDRGADFWWGYLEQAGVAPDRTCDLDNLDWVREVRSGDRILAAGGDGSVNRATGICLDTGASLAVLPSGTANDFFRNLGIDPDPEAICRALVDYGPQPVDVSHHDHGLCLNVAHIGLGTLPARDANSNGDAKKFLGQFSYLASLFRRLFTRRGFRATVATDTATVAGRWLSIAIANGAWFGGGTEVPGAALDNGRLVVIAVRPASLVSLAGAFITTRLLGRMPKDTKTVVQMSCPWCRVTSRRSKTVTVDGDVVGHTPLEMTCRPGELQVIRRPAGQV